MKMRVFALCLYFFIISGQVFSLVSVDGLSIKKRFDHNGGTDGYYLGDIAALGGSVYNKMWKGGYSKFIGDYGSYAIVDFDSHDVFYTIGQSVKRFKNTLNTPYSLYATDSGLVYVGDIGAGQIVFLSNTGSSLVQLNSAASSFPVDLYSAEGIVYAVNKGQRKITCFNADLTPLLGKSTIDVDGEPLAVAVDNRFIYILTRNMVLKYLKTGAYISRFEFDPEIEALDIDVDFYGNVYLLDKNGSLQKYSNSGQYICGLLGPGQGDYQLQSPNGFFIDRNGGDITVLDNIGLKVFSISTAIFDLAAGSSNFITGSGPVQNPVRFSLCEDSWVTVEIYNEQGGLVKTLKYNEGQPAGLCQLTWNGKDNAGNPVKPGLYTITVKAVEKYASFNTDVKTTVVNVKTEPSIGLTWLSGKAVLAGSPVLIFRFNTSEPMQVSFFLSNQADNYLISRGSYEGTGLFYYDYEGLPVPDGFYLAVFEGKTVDGYTCRALTNIIVHNNPLRLIVSETPAVYNPERTSALFSLFLTSDAAVNFSLPDGRVLQTAIMKGGSNVFLWNGTESSGVRLQDGVYSVNIKAAVADIESAETNLSVKIDTTPPALSFITTNSRYLSPLDSPGVQDVYSFDVYCGETAFVSVSILNTLQEEKAVVFSGYMNTGEVKKLNWDGIASEGSPVVDGEYKLVIKAADLAGNESIRYEMLYVDNNRAEEDAVYTGKTSLVKALHEFDSDVFWSKFTKKIVWYKYEQSGFYGGSYYLSCFDEGGLNDFLGKTINTPFSKFGPARKYQITHDEKLMVVIETYYFPAQNRSDVFKVYYMGDFNGFENEIRYESSYFNSMNFILPYGFLNPAYQYSNQIVRTFFSNNTEYLVQFNVKTTNQIILTNYNTNTDWLTYTPDNSVLAWANAKDDKTVFFRLSDKKIIGQTNACVILRWLNSTEFVGYRGNTVFVMNYISGAVTNIGATTQEPVEISADLSLLVSTDGTNVFVRDMVRKKTSLVASFDSIRQLSTWDPKRYNINLSLDSAFILTDAVLNGQRGFYRIDLETTVPENLTASLSYPNGGIDHLEGLVQVKGTAADTYFDYYTLSYKITGAPNWTTLVNSKNPRYLETLGNLDTTVFNDGTNVVLKLSAYDLAGNIREAGTTNKIINQVNYLLSGVSCDKDYMSLENTGNIKFFLKESASVSLKAKDSAGGEAIIFSGTVSGGAKTIPVPRSAVSNLQDGLVLYTVNAVLAGKTNSASGSLVLDKTSPALSLVNPLNTITSAETIEITGYLSDVNFDYYQIIINGLVTNTYNKLPVPSSQLLGSLDLQENELYTITVAVFDKAGNNAAAGFSIRADREPPWCSITSPQNGEVYSKTIPVSGIITDPNLTRFEIRVNDLVSYSGNSGFNGTINLNAPLNDGPSVLKILAYDTAGNVSIVTRDFIIDGNPPFTSLLVGTAAFENTAYKLGNTNIINGKTPIHFNAASGDIYSSVLNTFVSIDGGPYQIIRDVLFDAGSHSMSYYSVDNLGNMEAPKTLQLEVDNQPPVIDRLISQPYYIGPSNIYVPMNNDVRITAYDGLSGVDTAYYSIDQGKSYQLYPVGPFSQDGLFLYNPGDNEIKYFASDRVGNVSLTNSIRLFLDPVPPLTKVVLSREHYKKQNTFFYQDSITGSLSAYDFGSGVAGTFYRINNGLFIHSTNLPVFSTGTNLVEYYSLDFISNTEIIQDYTFIQDKEVPVTTLVIAGRTSTNGLVIYALPDNSYVLKASDALSGIRSSYLKLNDAGWVIGNSNFILNSVTNKLEYLSVDNLSNSEPVHQTALILDGEAPQTALSVKTGRMALINGQNYCLPGTVFQLSASDLLSGLKDTVLRMEGKELLTNELSLISNGIYSIGFFSIDKLGNTEEEKRLTLTVPIPDRVPPVVSISPKGIAVTNNGLIYGNNKLQVFITAADYAAEGEASTGVSEIVYLLNGARRSTTNSEIIAGLEPGLNHIEAFAVDNAFNISTTNTLVVIIDTEPPVTAADYTFTGWTNKTVLVKVSAEELSNGLNSGISNTYLSVNSAPFNASRQAFVKEEGVNTIIYYSLDLVGNSGKTNGCSVKIDTSSPEIALDGVYEGEIIGKGGAYCSMRAFDVHSGLRDVLVTIIRDNTPITNMYSSLEGALSNHANLPALTDDGNYIILIESADIANNSAHLSRSFTIDITPPDTVTNQRHLFDGSAVYLEWDSVTNTDFRNYNLYRDGLKLNQTTNTFYIDKLSDSTTHQYQINSEDFVSNLSLLTLPETLNTATNLLFIYPKTNVFFKKGLWIKAQYQPDDKDQLETNFMLKEDEDTDDHHRRILKEADNWCKWIEEWKEKDYPDKLMDLKLDFAVSNSLVPKNFIPLAEKSTLKKTFTKVLDLDYFEEGPHLIRIKAKSGSATLEDAAWFGIDQTAPVTYLVVDGQFIDIGGSDSVEIAAGSKIMLKSYDPIVNSASSGLKETWWSLFGPDRSLFWQKYNGEEISLNPGSYYLFAQGRDQAYFFFKNNHTGNIENLKYIKIVVGNKPNTNTTKIIESALPEIVVNGIADYGVYRNAKVLYSINGEFATIEAKIDGKTFSSPLEVKEKGKHRCRITVTGKNGAIVVRDIIFWIE